MAARNVVVAQSGGPTCVINNSLRGIVETCRRHPATFGTIYAGHFGIEGILKEALIDLSATPDEEIALLRFKLKSVIKNDPDNFRLITEALLSLNRLLRTRGRVFPDVEDSLARAYENVMRDMVIPMGFHPDIMYKIRGEKPPEIPGLKQDK